MHDKFFTDLTYKDLQSVVDKCSFTGGVKTKASKKRTIEKGNDFELKVRKASAIRERDLNWKIKNTDVVRFDDDDRDDNDD